MPRRRLKPSTQLGKLPTRWLAIKVELTKGRGEAFVPPAGRLFAAAPEHTFEALARQIDAAFARWDIAHLHEFEMPGGARVGPIDEDANDEVLDEKRVTLTRLRPGDVFNYTFDLADMWVHRCQVEMDMVDPSEVLGGVPDQPTPFFGWGAIPDQYGRASIDDTGD